MKIYVKKTPQQFQNVDYEYKFNSSTNLVDEIAIGDLQEKINSCNYTALDKLYDKFLQTGRFDLDSATSKGRYHSPNKLDDVLECEKKIRDLGIELGVNDNDVSLDEIMELYYQHIASKNEKDLDIEKVKENEKESEVATNA